MYILTKLFTHSFRRFLFPKTPDLSLILIPPPPSQYRFMVLNFSAINSLIVWLERTVLVVTYRKTCRHLFSYRVMSQCRSVEVTLRKSFVYTLVWHSWPLGIFPCYNNNKIREVTSTRIFIIGGCSINRIFKLAYYWLLLLDEMNKETYTTRAWNNAKM